MIATVSVMGILDNTGNSLKGLRLLVLAKSVSIQRRVKIASSLTFTANDFDMAMSVLEPDEVMFYDLICKDINLLVNKWGLTGIGVVQDSFYSNIKRRVFGVDKLDTFLDYLKVYNPNICFNPVRLNDYSGVSIYVDTAPRTVNYIHVNGNAVCTYKPVSGNKDYSSLRFNYVDGILVFSKYEDVFILTNTSARHIPVSLGEELTINLGNGYCVRTVSCIEENKYIKRVLYFDSLQRQWKVVSCSEPIEVFGRKKR